MGLGRGEGVGQPRGTLHTARDTWGHTAPCTSLRDAAHGTALLAHPCATLHTGTSLRASPMGFIGFLFVFYNGEEGAGAGIALPDLLGLGTPSNHHLLQQCSALLTVLQTPNFSNEFLQFKINNCSV